MTDGQHAAECREAFERWYTGTWPYANSPTQTKILYEAWQAAWELRAESDPTTPKEVNIEDGAIAIEAAWFSESAQGKYPEQVEQRRRKARKQAKACAEAWGLNAAVGQPNTEINRLRDQLRVNERGMEQLQLEKARMTGMYCVIQEKLRALVFPSEPEGCATREIEAELARTIAKQNALARKQLDCDQYIAEQPKDVVGRLAKYMQAAFRESKFRRLGDDIPNDVALILAEAAITAIGEPLRQPIETAPKGIPVIVAGGLAMQKTGGEWFSGMEEPLYQRPLQWSPSWWMPIPRDNARLGSESDALRAVATDRTTMRYEGDSNDLPKAEKGKCRDPFRNARKLNNDLEEA